MKSRTFAPVGVDEKTAFKKIQWKYFIDNKSIEQATNELMRIISKETHS